MKKGTCVICSCCGKEIYKPLSRVKRSKNHYCSPECYKKHSTNKKRPERRKGEYVDCDWCGDKTYKPSYRLKANKNNFCNKDCYQKFHQDKEKHNCHYCDKVIVTGKINSNNKHKFCDQTCYQKYRYTDEGKNEMSLAKLVNNGKENPEYCDSWYDPEYKETLKSDCCEECGVEEVFKMTKGNRRSYFLSNLVLHHKDRNKKNNVSENIKTLCRSCHATEHLTWRKVSEETRKKIASSNIRTKRKL